MAQESHKLPQEYINANGALAFGLNLMNKMRIKGCVGSRAKTIKKSGGGSGDDGRCGCEMWCVCGGDHGGGKQYRYGVMVVLEEKQ